MERKISISWLSVYRLVLISGLLVFGINSLFVPLSGDQIEFHYAAYKMTHWGLLPYRDYNDINFFGIFLYHILCQKLFGYSEFGFQLFALLNFLFLCITLRYVLEYLIEGIRLEYIYLILILYSATYYSVSWCYGQREIFILPLVLWSIYFFKKALVDGRWLFALFSGLFSGAAFSIKPVGGAFLVILVLLNLIYNYPYPNSYKKRLSLTAISFLGMFLVIFALAAYLARLGILAYFPQALTLLFGVKQYPCTFMENLYNLMLGSDLVGIPQMVKKAARISQYIYLFTLLNHALIYLMALAFIILKLLERNLKPYFIVICLFVIAVLLVFVQRTGNANHQMPAMCFGVILAVLLVRDLLESFKTYLAQKYSKQKENVTNLFNFAALMLVIVLSLPFAHGCIGLMSFKFFTGKIPLSIYQASIDGMKVNKDDVVKYIARDRDFNQEKDQVLLFSQYQYILYHSRARQFYKYPNNGLFLSLPKDFPLRASLETEFFKEFEKHPPKLIIVQKDDTNYSVVSPSFGWTTSYLEFMKYPIFKMALKEHYVMVKHNRSFVVFKRK